MSADDAPPAPPPGGAAPAAKLVAIVFGVATLALAGWWIWESVGDPTVDAADDGDLPQLPEPRAPSVRPMVASGGGFGWTWVNPRPRAMPTWYAVDATDGGARAVLVGHGGAAVRYEDGGLYGWTTGTERALRGVAWIAAREALAVGDHGQVVWLGPDGARADDAGTEANLRAVAALGERRAIVVGDGGTVLRGGPDDLVPLDTGVDTDLVAVHVGGDRSFAAGAAGTILRIEDDAAHPETSGVRVTLRGIGGCPGGSLYAAGDDGVLLRRRPDGTWHRVRAPGSEAFTAVACDHGRVAVVSADGRVVLVSGERTVELPSGFDRAWHGVDGAEEGASWVVGTGGRIATIEDDHVRTRTAGPTVPIRDLGGMGGALVAVGEWGRILRERESGLRQVESPTEAGLAAAIQMDEGRLIAVGDYGVMVDIRFDRARLIATPTRASLRDGVADDDALLVVGANGAVLRGSLDALAASAVPEVGDLWSITGTPSDAIAVGDGGAVLRFSATGFTRVPCDAAATLRAVTRTDEGVWAVGDRGTIVRIAEAACVEEQADGPTLHAVGLGPNGRLLAAGDRGTVLERTPDGDWAPAGVDVGGASLRAIWRGGRYVYVAGTGGVLVRHIVVDGT